MDHIHPEAETDPVEREAARDYLFDMIREMAKLARRTGDRYVAIHLEAIIAARRAIGENRSLL